MYVLTDYIIQKFQLSVFYVNAAKMCPKEVSSVCFFAGFKTIGRARSQQIYILIDFVNCQHFAKLLTSREHFAFCQFICVCSVLDAFFYVFCLCVSILLNVH